MKITLQGKLTRIAEDRLSPADPRYKGNGYDKGSMLTIQVGVTEYQVHVDEKKAQQAAGCYGKPATITIDLNPIQEGAS